MRSATLVQRVLGSIGEGRTVGYAAHGAAGMLTLFIRGVLCNWMVSTGVVGAMLSTSVGGKVLQWDRRNDLTLDADAVRARFQEIATQTQRQPDEVS